MHSPANDTVTVVMQGLFLRCDITQQRYAQLFTKPRLIHLPVPWCPPFISQDDSVKLSVITLGSDRLAGASATTHHPIPLLATSVSCGPPCACCKIKTSKCRSYVYERIPGFHISTLSTIENNMHNPHNSTAELMVPLDMWQIQPHLLLSGVCWHLIMHQCH